MEKDALSGEHDEGYGPLMVPYNPYVPYVPAPALPAFQLMVILPPIFLPALPPVAPPGERAIVPNAPGVTDRAAILAYLQQLGKVAESESLSESCICVQFTASV
ncbi:hypothetical protein ACET3Z_009959 [Daucus carota]